MRRRLLLTFTLRSTALALVVVIAISFAALIGLFEFLEVKAIDAAFALRGPLPPTAPIVIVAIDDESFAQTQLQWPWPRAYMAQLISQIAAGKPKVITTDIFWYEPGNDPGGDEALAKAIAEAGNVILANDINRVEQAGFVLDQFRRPIPALEDSALHTGLANLYRDPADGFIRQMPVYLINEPDGRAYFSWAALTTLTYLGASIPESIRPSSVQFGGITVPLTEGRLIVNYRGKPGSAFTQIQAYQVASGEVYQQRGPDFFRDKIVLIGATSVVLQDVYSTPFEGSRLPMPGVEVNAHVIDTLLSQQFIYRWPVILGAVVTLFIGLLAYVFSGIPVPFLSLTLAFGSGLGYLGLWAFAFNTLRIEMYVVAPLVSLTLGYAVPSVERAISEQVEKRRVRGIFERFVSPEMVEQMIDRGLEAVRGQRAELTIMFSDIRGFTTLSEQMSPDDVVAILNEYLGVMSDVIHRHGGTIDKYEGDLIMAFFNAPLPQSDHAKRALQAAIENALHSRQTAGQVGQTGKPPHPV
ncbi:MAG: adenylate/guanylate cyclase domain-containing protein [Chloroflexi bacterium]|nr:adenylate/guanylate cyclase domain-containing protein [Chloroflexota bacterium]